MSNCCEKNRVLEYLIMFFSAGCLSVFKTFKSNKKLLTEVLLKSRKKPMKDTLTELFLSKVDVLLRNLFLYSTIVKAFSNNNNH